MVEIWVLEMIKKNSGWFKSPDCTFGSPLSPLAKVVLFYFCRRADRNGRSFPSINKICKDTGIKSPTTVQKYINELIENDLVTKFSGGKKGGSNFYQLSSEIGQIVRKNSKSDPKETSNIDDPSSTKEAELGSNSDYPQSNSDSRGGQEMTTKENTYKENTYKEEENNRYDNNFSISTKEKNIENIKIPCRDMDVDRRICKKIERDRKNRLLNITGSYKDWSPENKALIKQTINNLSRKSSWDDNTDPEEIYEGGRKLKKG